MTADADRDECADHTHDPLDLALDWAERVVQIAAYWQRREHDDPGMGKIEAEIHGAGRQQFQAAQSAAYMALVSIAVDVRRAVDIMTGSTTPRVRVAEQDQTHDNPEGTPE